MKSEYQQKNTAHHFQPFSDNKELAAVGPRVITHAEGVYIYDDQGNKLLDAMAGLWCVNIGYGRKELVEAATQQMAELPYYNLFFKTVLCNRFSNALSFNHYTVPFAESNM